MCHPGVGHLPVILGCIMIFSIMTTYLVAALNGHVSAVFPYISDTGVKIPERNIFSQFLNIASFLAMINIYYRHKLVQSFCNSPLPVRSRLPKLNRASLVIGLLSCFGLSLVANFQEDTMEPFHVLGAMMVFGLGVVYAYMDSVVSFMMCPAFNGIRICWIRFSLGCVSLVCLITTMVAASVSRVQWAKGPIPPDHNRLHWAPTDPGYPAHLVSTFGEWALALAFLCYFFTFISDFQKMEVHIEARPYVSHLDHIPPDPPPAPVEPDERSKLIST